MKIQLSNYSQSSHEIKETMPATELDLDAALFVSDVKARLLLDRHDPYLDFKIALESVVHLDCDRCLEPYDQEVRAEGPMLFILGSPPDGNDVDDAELSYIPKGTHTLDLTAVLRDLLILAIPERHLCNDDCKGLCPMCGANLNEEHCACLGLSKTF